VTLARTTMRKESVRTMLGRKTNRRIVLNRISFIRTTLIENAEQNSIREEWHRAT
jgi:hypothetical protein